MDKIMFSDPNSDPHAAPDEPTVTDKVPDNVAPLSAPFSAGLLFSVLIELLEDKVALLTLSLSITTGPENSSAPKESSSSCML